MIVLIDYDLLNLRDKFGQPNYDLMKYYRYYNERTAVEVLTSLAAIQSMLPPEHIIVFSSTYDINKALWDNTLIPILNQFKATIQLEGLGFYGFERHLPEEIEALEPDYSAYFPWVKKMVVADKITINFCHNFTKTDVINPNEANYLKLLTNETKNKYCSISSNKFIYTQKGIEMLKELEKKYTRIYFYQPFKMSLLTPELLKVIHKSTRIRNNDIILNKPIETIEKLGEMEPFLPHKKKMLLLPNRKAHTIVLLVRNIEFMLNWLEWLLTTKTLPSVVLKDNFLSQLPIEWKQIYLSLRLWTNFEGRWRHRTLYEVTVEHSIDKRKMKKMYGESMHEHKPIYRNQSYIQYMMWFFRHYLDFDMRLFFIKKRKPLEEELIMTNFEIKDKRNELLTDLEKEVTSQLSQFVFNPNIGDIYAALTDLQEHCTHTDETGFTFSQKETECPFCGKRFK